MIDSKTGRRWKVTATSYYGTPHPSKATNRRERAEYRMEGGPNTALGDRVSKGDIAVPNNIPLGSVFYVPGYGWGIAKDHGGAIKGNRIDLATGGVVGNKVNPEARAAAQAWGRKNQTVYVFPPGHQIPKDHSPPQAFLNDLRRAKNSEAPIKTQSEKTINTAAVSEKKPFKPVVPKGNSSSEKADKDAYFNLLDEGNGRDYNNNEFIDLSEKATGIYENRLDRILEKGRYGSDSWPELKKQLGQIRDGITYQTYKKRINPDHASYLDKRLTDAMKELTVEGKIQPNNYKVGQYKRGDGSPEAQVEWPDPVTIPKTTPISRLASPVSNDVSIPNPVTKEVSLSGLGQEIAINPSAFTPTKTLRSTSSIAIDEKPTVTQNTESDSKSLAGSTGALLQTVKSGTPTSRSMSVSTPPSALTQTVKSEKPTPSEPKATQPQPSALTQYIKEINETDRIKADSVKGKKQYATAAKSYNNVRRSIDSSALNTEQKAKLRQIQGNYPYKG
jgi:3D (Asp-Asp-Asp) domain-containing protein